MNARPQVVVRFAGLAVLAGLAGLMLAAQPALARPSASGPAPVAGSQLWADVGGPGGATAMAVSPDSQTVYVTGSSATVGSGHDYATIAYGTSTGTQLWLARYNGPAKGTDAAASLAFSLGGKVFVTGTSAGAGTGLGFVTVAYPALP